MPMERDAVLTELESGLALELTSIHWGRETSYPGLVQLAATHCRPYRYFTQGNDTSIGTQPDNASHFTGLVCHKDVPELTT
jgi:hypothetical protein